MMAAWFVFEQLPITNPKLRNTANITRSILAIIVIVLTAVWAFAFQGIYLRDEFRIAASRWIFQNVPGPINVEYQTDNSTYNQPLPFPTDGFIQAGSPYDTIFTAQSDGLIESITLAHAANAVPSSSTVNLIYPMH